MFQRGRRFVGSFLKPKVSENDVERYARVSARMDRQFGLRKKTDGRLCSPGAIKQIEPVEGGMLIHAENASLSALFFAPNLVEIRVRPDRQFPPPFSYALSGTFERKSADARITEDAETALVGVGGMACRFSRPFWSTGRRSV
jgi:hypothetical protein